MSVEEAEKRLREELEEVGVALSPKGKTINVLEKHLQIFWCTLSHRAYLVAKKTMFATFKDASSEAIILRILAEEYKVGIDDLMTKQGVVFNQHLVNRDAYFYPGGYVLQDIVIGDEMKEEYKEKYEIWKTRAKEMKQEEEQVIVCEDE
jgi:hypothetical protein